MLSLTTTIWAAPQMNVELKFAYHSANAPILKADCWMNLGQPVPLSFLLHTLSGTGLHGPDGLPVTQPPVW